MNSINDLLDEKNNPQYSHIETKFALEMKVMSANDVIRQYPIGPYFADFYFPENSLVLEIDGYAYHSTDEQIKHDRKRDQYMKDRGYCIVRVDGSTAKKFTSGIITICKQIKRPGLYFIRDERHLKELMILCSKEIKNYDNYRFYPRKIERIRRK